MSTTTRSKGGGKQAAARSEKSTKPRQVTWKGAKLETPAKLPPTLMLDIGRIEALGTRGEQPFGAMYELLESLIGADGIAKVRAVLAKSNGDSAPFEVFGDVVETIMKAHGTNTGESSASAPS